MDDNATNLGKPVGGPYKSGWAGLLERKGMTK